MVTGTASASAPHQPGIRRGAEQHQALPPPRTYRTRQRVKSRSSLSQRVLCSEWPRRAGRTRGPRATRPSHPQPNAASNAAGVPGGCRSTGQALSAGAKRGAGPGGARHRPRASGCSRSAWARWNGQRWYAGSLPLPGGYTGSVRITGTEVLSRSDIWAVGNLTVASVIPYVGHFNGRRWSFQLLRSTDTMVAVSGSGPDNVWIAGNSGTNLLRRCDGRRWRPVPNARRAGRADHV